MSSGYLSVFTWAFPCSLVIGRIVKSFASSGLHDLLEFFLIRCVNNGKVFYHITGISQIAF